MARRTPFRVQMRTSTTGNGPFTLTNPSPVLVGKRTIAEAVADGSLVNGDEILYAIIDAAAAGTGKLGEVGRGTINTTTLVLTVVQVYEKSALLTSGGGWGAGTRDVLISPPGAFNTAFTDLANTFLANQTIDGVSPTLQFQNGGNIRGRVIYTSSVFYNQYFNGSGVLRGATELADSVASLKHYTTGGVQDGSLDVGAASLNFVEGGVTRKVVRFRSGGLVKMVFYQAAAELNWTKDTSQNDKALRVVSGGTGGTSGGSRVLSSATVGGTSLSTAQLASHSHNTAYNVSFAEGFMPSSPIAVITSLGPGGASNASSTSQGSDTTHDHALALAYIDVIVASFD